MSSPVLHALVIALGAPLAIVLGGACSEGKTGSAKGDGPANAKCIASDEARQAYATCRKSADEASCKQNGGAWDQVPGGYSQGPVMACVCQLPDAGCPCAKSGDCTVRCEMSPPANWKSCPAEGPATCTGGGHGCYCYLDDKGKSHGICQD